MIIYPVLKTRANVNETSTPKCPRKPKCICIASATGSEIVDVCEYYKVDLDAGEMSKEDALIIKGWRTDGCTWRRVAEKAAERWPGPWIYCRPSNRGARIMR